MVLLCASVGFFGLGWITGVAPTGWFWGGAASNRVCDDVGNERDGEGRVSGVRVKP